MINFYRKSVTFFRKPSKTVPDKAYTVSELLAKFTTGICPSVYREGSYSDNENLQPEDIDITETRDFDSCDARRLLSSCRDISAIMSDLDKLKRSESNSKEDKTPESSSID